MRWGLYLAIIVFSYYFTKLFVLVPIVGGLLLAVLLFCALFLAFPKPVFFLFFMFLMFQGLIAHLLRIGLIFNFDELGIACMLMLITARKLVLKRPFFATGIEVPLILLVSLGLVSSAVHKIVPWPVGIGGLFLFLKGFMLYAIAVSLEISPRDLASFKTWLYGLGVVTFVYGVLGMCAPTVFIHGLGFAFYDRFGIPAAQSFLGHPGVFSAFMGVLFCFAFVDSLALRGLAYRVLAFVFFSGCVLSLRRTTLTGVVLASAVVFCSARVRKALRLRVSMRVLPVALMVGLVFGGVVFAVSRDLTSTYLQTESPRSRLLEAGLRIAADYFPLGSGFGTYSGGINMKYYSPLFYTHRLNHVWGLTKDNPSFANDTFWPHIIAETGYVGLFLYLLILVLFFKTALRAMAVLPAEEARYAVVALMLLILSVVESMKAPFYEEALWTFFYFGGVGVLQYWLFIRRRNHERLDHQ